MINKELIEKTIQKELDWDINSFEIETEKINKLSWCKYEMIDSHIHIVDFNQKTKWLKNLIKYMDKSNIKAWVIFGMPIIKIWQENEKIKPNYYLDDDNPCYYYSNTDAIVAKEYLSLSKKDKKRFFPLMCWFNPNDINSVDHIIQTFNTFPWIFCGIWEVFYRHDDLTHMIYWEPPRMNTIATKKLFEFLTKYDLPIIIHNNITTPWISDFPKFLHEIEEVVREYPKTKVVLAHCWASRRLQSPYYIKMISRLLSEYDELYVDFSWVIFEEIIAINDVSLQEWVKLSEKFSNKIMIWSDILWDNFEEIWLINSKFNIFLDKLTPQTREKICLTNAINLFSKTRNRIEKNKIRTYEKIFV